MTLDPQHDEKFRMMLERLIGFCTMHGRDMHKNPDAWGEKVRECHGNLVRYVEARMFEATPRPSEAPTPGSNAAKEE